MKTTSLLWALALGMLAFGQNDQAPSNGQATRLAPSYFVANTANQKSGKRMIEDPEVLAFLQTQSGRVLFTPSGAYFDVTAAPASADAAKYGNERAVLKAGFAPAHAKQRGIQAHLQEKATGKVNYLVGPRENWQQALPTYKKLSYGQVWDGISLEFRGSLDKLEARLVLEPGSDPNAILLETGAPALTVDPRGDLVAELAQGALRFQKPHAYQVIDGVQRDVEVAYRPDDQGRFSFHLGPYDAKKKLIISPTLVWSTYLGGPGTHGGEAAGDLALDSTGIYITGSSHIFPTTPGVFAETNLGTDIVVAKLNSNGSTLLFSTFLGGTSTELAGAIAIDSDHNIYVTGGTLSTNFPTAVGAYDRTANGLMDIFVSKLSSDGTTLLYSTLAGGNKYDTGTAIVVSASGVAYVAGSTISFNFPTTAGAFQTTNHSIQFNEMIIFSLNATATALNYSTYLGGSYGDNATGLALDASGCLFVAGSSSSSDFPTTAGVFDQSYDHTEGIVAKLNPTGTALVYSTFLGGSTFDNIAAIAVDASGAAFVAGNTLSPDFPKTLGAYSAPGGDYDVFVCKLSADGSSLDYAACFGGSSSDHATNLAIDDDQAAYVLGYTISENFPSTPGAYSDTLAGHTDLFVAKVSADGSQLVYATYLGGEGYDYSRGLAIDDAGNAYPLSATTSIDFPVTPNAYQSRLRGSSDLTVTCLDSQGSSLIFSTYIGGLNDEELADSRRSSIATDSAHAVYILSTIGNVGFPTTSGTYSEQHSGSADIAITKLTTDGTDMVYGTYLGGKYQELGSALVVDATGFAYVTGRTTSPDFPTTPGSLDTTVQNADTFLTKLNLDGSDLEFSTALGGSGIDESEELALDSFGNCYLLGKTSSTDFPVTPGAYLVEGTGTVPYLAKLDPTGSSLIYAAIVGKDSAFPADLAVDDTGCTYALCRVYFTNPTTPGAFDETYNGGIDMYLLKLNAAGTAAVYATYLGGTTDDTAVALAVDADGYTYLLGRTSSSNFPTSPGAFDQTINGSNDMTVSKLDPTGSELIYSTFLGGNLYDWGTALQVDAYGGAYILGTASSTNFPTTPNALFPSKLAGDDLVVTRLSRSGSSLTYSSYLGGNQEDIAHDLALDADNLIYVVGQTTSSGIATTPGAYQETMQGNSDLIIYKLELCPRPQPDAINGPASVCEGETGVVYSIDAISGATGYTWSLPEDAVLFAGEDTTEITVDFGSSAGEIRIRAEFDCGPGPWQSLAIDVAIHPSQPEPITGEDMVCAGDSGVYSIASVADATGYVWTVPVGTTITKGQDTNAITVDFGGSSGAISVKARFACGFSHRELLPVTVYAPIAIQSSPEDQSICPGETLSAEVVASGDELSYQWYRDGQPLSDGGAVAGATSAHLTIQDLDVGDEGLYTCEINNFCGQESPDFELTVDGPLQVSVNPPGAVQGLQPLSFTANTSCFLGPLDLLWTNLNTGQVFSDNPLTLTVEETTELELQVSDASGDLVVRSVWILYAPTGDLDLNGDGVNTIEDLLFSLPDWHSETTIDLDGDGQLTILDFLYVNIGP